MKHQRRKTDSRPALPPKSSRLRILVWSAVGAVAVAAVGYAILAHDDPQQLFLQAQQIASTDPSQAEPLLYRSIEAAAGDFPEAQLLLCRLLAAQGRWDEARGGFSLIQRPERCDANDLAQLASQALAAQELVLPDLAMNAALIQSPLRPEILRVAIELQGKLGRFGTVLDHCEELESLDPTDAFPWVISGQIFERRKEILPAIAAYRQALDRSLSPAQRIAVRSKLIELLIQSNAATAARTELDRLLAESPAAATSRLTQVRLLRLEGKLPEALTLVGELLLVEPQSAGALMLRGILYLDRQAYAEAARDLTEVTRLLPYNKEAHYKLAQACRELGRAEESQAHLATSQRLVQASVEILNLEYRVQHESESAELYPRLVALCEQIGETDMAEQWRQVARAKGP